MSSQDSGFGGRFWERKVRTFFKLVDIDGNGYITKGDYESLADRYKEMGKLDDVKAKQVRRKLVKVWFDLFEADSTDGRVDEATFCQSARKCEALIFTTATQFHGLFFDLIDLSGDGIIQKDEFRLFFKVFGIGDEQQVIQSFNGLDSNGDGELSYEEFVQAGCQYFISGDEALPSKFLYGPLVE